MTKLPGCSLAAGNVVSATVDYTKQDIRHQGVALFELETRHLRIISASFYWPCDQDTVDAAV